MQSEFNITTGFIIQINIFRQVYFRQKLPVVFEGDMTDEEGILSWLTSQEVFEIPGEIEEVNRKMLEKILEENEFVAVYFCKLEHFYLHYSTAPAWLG